MEGYCSDWDRPSDNRTFCKLEEDYYDGVNDCPNSYLTNGASDFCTTNGTICDAFMDAKSKCLLVTLSIQGYLTVLKENIA